VRPPARPILSRRARRYGGVGAPAPAPSPGGVPSRRPSACPTPSTVSPSSSPACVSTVARTGLTNPVALASAWVVVRSARASPVVVSPTRSPTGRSRLLRCGARTGGRGGGGGAGGSGCGCGCGWRRATPGAGTTAGGSGAAAGGGLTRGDWTVAAAVGGGAGRDGRAGERATTRAAGAAGGAGRTSACWVARGGSAGRKWNETSPRAVPKMTATTVNAAPARARPGACEGLRKARINAVSSRAIGRGTGILEPIDPSWRVGALPAK
jgi:hypothetical protein